MRSMILADTGPLYASAVQKDAFHERANQELQYLIQQGYNITIPYTTLCECYSLLSRRTHQKLLIPWQKHIRKSFSQINPTQIDFHDACLLLETYHDQKITMFDAILAVLSQKLEVPVWTFDRDFYILRADEEE